MCRCIETQITNNIDKCDSMDAYVGRHIYGVKADRKVTRQ